MGIGAFFPIAVQAEEVSTVTYEHIQLEDLSQNEQENIIRERPTVFAEKEAYQFTLVYEPTVVGIQNQEPPIIQIVHDNVKPSTNAKSYTRSVKENSYPKTGEELNVLLPVAGGLLLIGALGIYLLRKRKGKLFIAILGTASLLGTNLLPAEAAQRTHLIDNVVETVNIGEQIYHDPEIIAGYVYVGYLVQEEEAPMETGIVNVRYVDSNGKNLSEPVVLTGAIGETYQTEEKTFDGYTFKQVEGETKGAFTTETQTIIYQYEKVKAEVTQGRVVVNYEDEEGNVLDTLTLSGEVGTAYETEEKVFDGYNFKSLTGERTGLYTDGEQVITYVYSKTPVIGGTVTVHYLDENGENLTEPVEFNGNIGESYVTEEQDFEYYDFVSVEGETEGFYTTESQEVTYHYTAQTSTVHVSFINQNTGLPFSLTDISSTSQYLTLDSGDIQGYNANKDVTNLLLNGETLTGKVGKNFELSDTQAMLEKYQNKTDNLYIYGWSSTESRQNAEGILIVLSIKLEDNLTGSFTEEDQNIEILISCRSWGDGTASGE